MINLMARLGFDGSPFFKGLSQTVGKAKEAGAKMGADVGKEFGKKVKQMLGAGALIGGALSTFMDAQEIRDQAAAFGVSTQQMAAMELVAKKLGETTNVTTDEFMRLVNEVIDSGQIADDNVLSRLASSADDLEESLKRVKATAASVLGFIVKSVESFGAGVGGFFANLDASKSTTAGDRIRQFKQFFSDSWNSSSEGRSISERAVRTRQPAVEKEAKVKAEAAVRAEKEERRKLGLPNTPFADRGGGSLAAMGLGPGYGATFNLQRQILSELKRLNNTAAAQARDIKKNL